MIRRALAPQNTNSCLHSTKKLLTAMKLDKTSKKLKHRVDAIDKAFPVRRSFINIP
jgi:hypothetical protein